MPKCCELLFIMMKDLCKHADDTVWLMGNETVFERLVEIYRESGGNMKVLENEFPDYPICHESNYEGDIND